ncbi:PfkB family carbohydrate kinase [Pseudolabrys sp. FHR47]|uniref:PfkB family carbohydrate kinase n=1 Tax=Pseudolabrys sp. FHR47 TaxID=2562284 RepID=UPI0010BEA999|nr:PfkB family carbohydrate kinase [Pseudolabrys sp. FHR47]
MTGTSQPVRIVCAGGAVQDNVMRVEKFPAPGEKVSATDFVITSGGQAGNAAVAMARLGAQVTYIGAVGDETDDVANTILKTFAKENIDVSHAIRVPGARSAASLILLDAEGEKMIATMRPTGLHAATPADPDGIVANADAAMLDNRYSNISLPICLAAKKRGIPRVLDFDKPTPADDPLFQACSHVICSADAIRESTGVKDLPGALKKLGESFGEFLAVTDGPDGVYWLDRDQGSGEVRHMDAFKVKSVDTLGAGDTFHGAFAVHFVETRDVVKAMRFAAAAAAIKCTRFGGLMGAATRDEVDAFLKERG